MALERQIMDIHVRLPADIKSIDISNPHHIRLRDQDGNELELLPAPMVRYKCEACGSVFLIEGHHSNLACPICGGANKATAQWGSRQLVFAPQTESKFKSSLLKPDEEDDGNGEEEVTKPGK